MSTFIGEFFGTALLIVLGNGVVANVVLDKTKGNNGGLIAITFGWAIAVFTGVYAATALGSKGHLNPAVTIAMAAIHKLDAPLVFPYIAAQFTGAFTGAVIVWAAYKNHFETTDNADLKLAVFCTSPAIRKPVSNIFTEVVGTFVLVFGALLMSAPTQSMGTLDALPVALLVLGIGLSLGGPTGYAINPARDLAPRIAHFILPISGKRDSDWEYALIPVIAPIAGGLLAVIIFTTLS